VQCNPEKEQNVMKYTANSLMISLPSKKKKKDNIYSAVCYKAIMTQVGSDTLEMVNTYFS
jgi:hypothetical protein